MKRKRLTVILIGAIALAGLSSAGFAVAQTFSNIGQSWFSRGLRLEFDAGTLPADESQRWQEMKQKFIDAGIDLTPQQAIAIREAQRQLIHDFRQILQDESLAKARQQITTTSLTGEQRQALIEATGLGERLGNSLLTYRASVLNVLTPEQRPIWEERVWQRLGK